MIKHITDKDNYWVRVTWRKTVVPYGDRKVQTITNLSRDRASQLYRRYDYEMEILDIYKVEMGRG
jgi:hypothetical protein